MAEHFLSDLEPRVETGCLLLVELESVRQAWRRSNHRASRFDSSAHLAQPPLRSALVRLPRVVREAARDLEEAEPPMGVAIAIVPVASLERHPRPKPRPRLPRNRVAFVPVSVLQVPPSGPPPAVTAKKIQAVGREDTPIRSGSRAGLIVLAGLPGSGKSTVARGLARQLSAVWLRVDTLEAAMLEAGLPLSFETGLAAYLGVRDQARDHLKLGRWVILDAVNGVSEARELWNGISAELSVDKWVVELVCPNPAEHRRRVESRPPPTPPLPKPTWEEVRAREYVPWTEPVLSLDTTLPTEQNLVRVLDYLQVNPVRPAGPKRLAG